MFVMLGIEKPIEVEVARSRYLCPISSTHERDHVQLVFVPVASEIAKTSQVCLTGLSSVVVRLAGLRSSTFVSVFS